MKDIIEILNRNGGMLTSDLSAELVKRGYSEVAARQKISRSYYSSNGQILKLPYLTFPHRAKFAYLKNEGYSERFYNNLYNALNKTNSVYRHTFNLLKTHYGVLNENRFRVYSSSPEISSKHINYATVLDNLIKLKLCEYKNINNVRYIYLTESAWDEKRAIAIEKIELLLVDMLKEWLKRTNFASYKAIDKTRNYGYFYWDISAPSFISPFIIKDKPNDKKIKHGFVVADVVYNIIDENTIKYFINKLNIVKANKNNRLVIPILMAQGYTQEAFNIGRSKGIVIVTPEILFGKDIADMFENLLYKLSNIAAAATKDIEEFLKLYDQLAKIEGAAAHLYGDLFEFIIGVIYREFLPITSLEIGKLISISTGDRKEIDVYIKTTDKKIYFIECKGYSQKTTVAEKEAQYWVEKVPLLRKWGTENIDNFDKLEQHYEFLTTSDFDAEAKQIFDEFNQKTKRYQIEYMNGKQLLAFIKSKNIDSKDKIIKTLNEHYLKMEI